MLICTLFTQWSEFREEKKIILLNYRDIVIVNQEINIKNLSPSKHPVSLTHCGQWTWLLWEGETIVSWESLKRKLKSFLTSSQLGPLWSVDLVVEQGETETNYFRRYWCSLCELKHLSSPPRHTAASLLHSRWGVWVSWWGETSVLNPVSENISGELALIVPRVQFMLLPSTYKVEPPCLPRYERGPWVSSSAGSLSSAVCYRGVYLFHYTN